MYIYISFYSKQQKFMEKCTPPQRYTLNFLGCKVAPPAEPMPVLLMLQQVFLSAQEFWWFQRHIVLDTSVSKLGVLVRKMFGRITILIFFGSHECFKTTKTKDFRPQKLGPVVVPAFLE